jgi:DnaK suppressor protein
MDQAEMNQQQIRIRELIAELESQLPYLEGEAKGDPYSCSIGTVSWMDAQNDKGVNAQILDRNRKRIERLRNALRRIDAGTYGICIRCGKHIAPGRLAAVPEALICIPCSEKKPGRA